MKTGDPVIHELYKAILRYRYEAVKKILLNNGIVSRLLSPDYSRAREDIKIWSEEELFRVKQVYKKGCDHPKQYLGQISQGRGIQKTDLTQADRIYADVVWKFDYRTELDITKCQYLVAHEVKTGIFDINEIFQKYSQYTAFCISKKRSKEIDQLWIWSQQRYIEDQIFKWKNEIPHIKKGLIKILPIEWLTPLVRETLLEHIEWFYPDN